MRKVFYGFADFAERFALGRANHRRHQTFFQCHCDAKVHVVVLHDRVAIERSVRLRHFHRGLNRGLEHEIVHRDLRAVAFFAG